MIGRIAAVIYGIASYFVFFCSLLYAIGFIGNYLVPPTLAPFIWQFVWRAKPPAQESALHGP